MNPDQRSSRTRKHKYHPRKLKPQAPKTEEAEDKQVEEEGSVLALARALARRRVADQNHARREPRVEKNSSAEVTFSPEVSSPSLRTYGTSKSVDSGTNSGLPSKYLANEQIPLRRSSAATEDQNDTCIVDDDATDDTTNASARKIKGEYKEPWDYNNSNYPITLPLRKPNSGNPEILDEEEFGKAAAGWEYDENTVNSAAELELLEKSEEQRMLFFQFPSTLPLVKESNKGKGTTPFEELPRGYLGKMLVYKSGAIKLKLGETMFDVCSGSKTVFDQKVVAVNTAQKQCCSLGEISKKVVVAPDIDSIDL